MLGEGGEEDLVTCNTQIGIFLEIFRRGRGGRSTERHALDPTNEYISVVSLWKTI
jgi:hypothetical protein